MPAASPARKVAAGTVAPTHPAPTRRRRPSRQVPRPARNGRRASSRPTRATRGPVQLIPVAVGRTAVAVSDLADSGLMVRLTRGRLWIGLLAALLAGIVALNVLSLGFSASASRMATQADALERKSSVLRARLAKRLSSERVGSAAASLGLYTPEPGEITYLETSERDAETAARRIEAGELATAPSEPVIEPSAPAVEPTNPAVEPSEPAIEPGAAADPTAPTAEPSNPAIEPSEPAAGPGGLAAPP